jgi:peptidyl-prolyl cis-trans isomerase B (cyclophilin B)
MKKALLVLVCGILFAGCSHSQQNDITLTKTTSSTPPTTAPINNQGETMKTIADFEPIEATQATIHTNKGDITVTLFREQAPLTTLNFLNLAKNGFYDGIIFHRVIEDFMAQVGDPLTKEQGKEDMWGSGGPGYVIADEFATELTHSKAGILSMANRGPNTGGSQFFITYEATPWLDGKHTVFGEVTSGMDVLNAITVGDKIVSISYQ